MVPLMDHSILWPEESFVMNTEPVSKIDGASSKYSKSLWELEFQAVTHHKENQPVSWLLHLSPPYLQERKTP